MIKIIDIPIYRCSVICLYGSTLDDWSEFFDKQLKEDKLSTKVDVAVRDEYENNSPGFVLPTGYNDYVMYVNDAENVGLVAHEIFHAAHCILYDRGCEVDGTAEPEAYLIEFITSKFYTEWLKEESKENNE